jgi:hypothetical protein
MEFLNTPEKRNRRMVHIPMGRFGEAIEQAKAALFRQFHDPPTERCSIDTITVVASDESSYITVSELTACTTHLTD